MSLLSLFQFNTDKDYKEIEDTVEDKVIIYLTTLVNRTDLIAESLKRYSKSKRKVSDGRINELISIYFSLESFITTHKEPFVKDIKTKAELRNEIKNNFPLDELSESFRVIFLDDKRQAFYIYKYSINFIIKYIFSVFGAYPTTTLVKSFCPSTIFEGLTISETDSTLDFTDLDKKLDELEFIDLNQNFKDFYEYLYHEVGEQLGSKNAINIVEKTYDEVKNTYSYEFIYKLLEIVPPGILELEKLSYLSREQLERRVSQAVTGEKTKRQLAESITKEYEQKVAEVKKQNEELEKTKAAVINLLKDARELEEQLIDERDKAKTIIQSMNEAVLLIDKQGTIETLNPIAITLLGVNESQSIGKKIDEVFQIYQGEERIEKDAHPAHRTLSEDRNVTVSLEDNYYLLKSDTIKIPIAINTSPLRSDGLSGAVIFFTDVTAEKEKREQIEALVKQRTLQVKEEQAKLTASINSMPKGFILTDINGQIILANSSALKALDATETLLNIAEIHHILGTEVDLLGKFNNIVHNQAQAVLPFEVTFGSKFLKIFINPIYLSVENQQILGAVFLVDDVTEERVLQRSRDEFFSIASHELRTPLTAIRGNTSMIMNHYADISPEEMKQLMESIYQSSLRLINIVNEFLTTSRLEQGRMVFDLMELNFSEIVTTVLQEVDHLIKEKNLYITVDNIDINLPKIKADGNKLREVLMNLIGNSVKFTDTGGITLKAVVEEDYMNVFITDTGRGVPLSNQSLLFRKFQQASNNILTRDTTSSTGLGLYITKLIMEGMNGSISLYKSEENQGSTFLLKIPLYKE
jgi:PAS domain S-box-containing protein